MPDQLTKAIAKWQEMLSVFLDENELADQPELLAYMAKWQKTLEQNRFLLESHQKDLIEQLKEGEATLSQQEQAKKYKRQQD